MKVKEINLVRDFSKYLCGRFRTDSYDSGERLRDDFLIPMFLKVIDNEIDLMVVNIEGMVGGCGGSSSEEAFGGLVRSVVKSQPNIDLEVFGKLIIAGGREEARDEINKQIEGAVSVVIRDRRINRANAIKEVINKINNIQYEDIRNGINSDLSFYAASNHLVIAYGLSDDILRLDGAIISWGSAFDGVTAFVSSEDHELIDMNEHESGTKLLRLSPEKPLVIDAKWSVGEYSWVIDVNTDHGRFTIMDDEDKYCLGAVFSIEGIK